MTITEPNPGAIETAESEAPLGPLPEELRAKVPFAMQDWNFVPRERYYDRGFYELEKKAVWPHVWQMAARLEEIPNAGDFVEYEITDNSILIVRQRDGSVKALHNSCRHRGTQLAKGCGRFPGGQIVCPFHGWRWNTDGSSSFVFLPEEFEEDTMRPEDLSLRECKVETWAGMVWINMDHNAPPLSEALFPAMDYLDGVAVGNMRVKWWKQVILNANWKMAQEAFHEGYHAMQTHPQLLMGMGEPFAVSSTIGTDYTSFRNGHGRFQPAEGDEGYTAGFDGAKFIEAGRLLADGQDAMTLEQDVKVFEGIRNKVGVDNPNFIQEAITALYEYAAGAGIPMAPPSDKLKLWSGEIFVYPNFFMLPMYGNCLSYRLRPHNDNPEWVLFDVWSLTTYPEGEEPERAELMGVFDKEDDEHWGLIPRQDFSNIERQQKGIHSVAYDHHRLSSNLERNIANMHHELDRTIAKHS